jgi:hypothetical protein
MREPLKSEIDDESDGSPATKASRSYTAKQMGDACEMLVAAEMTLAGVPTQKMADNWPGYDLIAQPTGGRAPQRISVKSRSTLRAEAEAGRESPYFRTRPGDVFEWLAVVSIGRDERSIFVIPYSVWLDRANGRDEGIRFLAADRLREVFPEYENNFTLDRG